MSVVTISINPAVDIKILHQCLNPISRISHQGHNGVNIPNIVAAFNNRHPLNVPDVYAFICEVKIRKIDLAAVHLYCLFHHSRTYCWTTCTRE